MDDRPDWLPEDMEYYPARCLCSGSAVTRQIVYRNPGTGIEVHLDLCDSPECEQAAREAICGGDDG